MLQGLDESFGAAVFVGYHSCAGTEGGVLNHTMLGKEVQNIYLNGAATEETRLNAGLAGSYGVSVAWSRATSPSLRRRSGSCHG